MIFSIDSKILGITELTPIKEFTASLPLLNLNREWCHQLIKNPLRFVSMGSSYLLYMIKNSWHCPD